MSIDCNESKFKALRWSAICVLLCMFILFPVALAFAPAFSWVDKASLPSPRFGATAVVLTDGKILVAGGRTMTGPGAVGSADVNVYDPATDTWESRNPLFEKRWGAGDASQGNTVYLVGGGNDMSPTDTIIAYDANTETSTVVGHLQNARNMTDSDIIGDTIYVAGGENSGVVLDSIEAYNLVSNTSTVTATMPAARVLQSVVSVGGKLYMMGGLDNSGNPTSTCWEYDPGMGSITPKSNMPVAVASTFGKAIINGKIYLAGGITSTGLPPTAFTGVIQEYDPATDTWSLLDSMPTPRGGATCVAVGDTLYVIGGYNGMALGINEAGTLTDNGGPPSTGGLKAITVPMPSNVPHPTYNGRQTTFKAIARSGAPPYTYRWDYGDGITGASDSSSRIIEDKHTYPDSPHGTVYTATLTVTDSLGNTASDPYTVVVRNKTQDVEVDIAIDEGLWWLFKNQNEYDGSWPGYYNVGYTGLAVEAFENQGYLPGGNPDESPYVEAVQKGLGYILTSCQPVGIDLQPAGNPDTNGNGIGIACYRDGWESMYQQPIALMALVSSLSPDTIATTGPANVKGRTYGEIARDMVDYISWAQNEVPTVRDGVHVYDLISAETTCVVPGRDMAEPKISGNWVVWTDYRSGGGDIYGYDLSVDSDSDTVPNWRDADRPSPDPALEAICTNPSSQYNPDISGDWVVWTDYRNGADIYGYNLVTGEERAICDNPAYKYNPAIDGNKVVWYDDRNGSGDIYGIDLSTGIEFAVCTDSGYQADPDIDGDWVVWTDARNGWNYDIYGHNLTTGVEIPVSTDPAYQYGPSISGNKVVWTDYRMGYGSIYSYDLSTGAESAVGGTNNAYQADVDGRYVAFTDYSLGTSQIFLYDFDTQKTEQLTSDQGYKYYPSISNNLIAWLTQSWSDPNCRGGWRYGPNYGSSDNSVTQWPVIALKAAEDSWGISPPAWVKTELEQWLNYSQNKDTNPDGTIGANYGAFGYDSPQSWLNVAKTGGGICGLSYLGAPVSDERIQAALGYLDRNWDRTTSPGGWDDYANFGNYYAMYAVMKGMRIANPQITAVGAHDWYSEYARYLVDNQQAAGNWPTGAWGDETIDTAWAVLILTPSVFSPPPVAVADASPHQATLCPPTGVVFSHSTSYHLNPNRAIAKYEWDFDGDGVFDYETTDASATPTHTYGAAGTYTAKLRVTDDDATPKFDEDTVVITVESGNIPPTADPGGPYSGYVGQPITLDGSGSADPNAGCGDSIQRYEWDLDGDEDFNDAEGEHTGFTWTTPGAHRVGLRVTDSQGAADVAWTTATIETKQPTTLTYLNPFSVQYSDKTPVEVKLTNKDGGALAGKAVTVEVTNPNQTLTSVTQASGIASEGYRAVSGFSLHSVYAMFAGDNEYIASNCNGAFEEVQENATLNYSGDVLAPITQNITLKAHVTGEDDGYSGDLSKIDPAHVKFYLTNTDGTALPPISATSFALISAGTPGGDAPGSPESGTFSVATTLPAGVYSVIVKLEGDNYYVAPESKSAFVVAYDPNGGFATGGGWINPDSESTLAGGRANFGFVAKYKNGVSTGNLEFQYQNAEINLKSKTIDWLVISATSAQFQGTATINGSGLYTFRVLAKDEGEPSTGTDSFDIRIWEGTDTETDPYHKAKNTLAGGNIVVHKK